MKAISHRSLTLLIFLSILLYFPSASFGRSCAYCNRPLGFKHIKYKGDSYCSLDCVDRVRPRCKVCGKIIRSGYGVNKKKETFCSEACFFTTLPKCEACRKPFKKGVMINTHSFCEDCYKNNKKCFSCNLPARYSTPIEGDRTICIDCQRWAVNDAETAKKNYDRARKALENWTSIPIKKLPELQLINFKEMKERSKSLRKTDSTLTFRGLYSRQNIQVHWLFKKNSKERKETIYIIDHLHDEIFRVSAVHELMHHFLYENYPKMEKAPLWAQEGICQYAAADFCRQKVYTESLQSIENSKDPDYGDGYRFIRDLIGFQGWKGLKKWLDEVNPKKLPKEAPISVE